MLSQRWEKQQIEAREALLSKRRQALEQSQWAAQCEAWEASERSRRSAAREKWEAEQLLRTPLSSPRGSVSLSASTVPLAGLITPGAVSAASLSGVMQS